MIVYISIFAVVLFVIVQLFWQVQLAEVKSTITREVKENASQVTEVLKHYIRQSEDVDTGSSVFGSHPGTLLLVDDGNVIIDTYTRIVDIGTGSKTIRKLRLTEAKGDPVDLTSDHVDVSNFVLTNLTQGANPDTILIDLTLDAVNPGYDPLYDHSFSIRINSSIRQES